jgi:hypothetical protein
LEALGYMLVYFAKGVLPWQGLKKKPGEDSIKIIGDKKMSTSLNILCSGLPPCFAEYIRYCRALTFKETPDYKYLIDLFTNCSESSGIPIEFEW